MKKFYKVIQAKGRLILVLVCVSTLAAVISCPVEVFKPIGPVTLDCISQLETAISRSEVEEGIGCTVEKVGLGVPVSGSDYEFFNLSQEDISELAEFQLLSRTVPEILITIREAFETLNSQLGIQGVGLNTTTEQVVSRLQSQLNEAFRDTEDPNNALLLIMTSTTQTTTPPTITPETMLAPIQSILFDAWLINEFSPEADAISSSTKGLAPTLNQETPEECLTRCRNEFRANISRAFRFFRFCIIRAAAQLNVLDQLPAALEIFSSPPSNVDALRVFLEDRGVVVNFIESIIGCFLDFVDSLLRAIVDFATCVNECPTGSPGGTSQ